MSGWTSRAHAGFQAVSRRFRALCSICVHVYLCETYANWRAMVIARREDKAEAKKWLKRARKASNFPVNTDGCSRHVRMMAEGLIRDRRYSMFADEPLHCATSLLVTVTMLLELRNATGMFAPGQPMEKSEDKREP